MVFVSLTESAQCSSESRKGLNLQTGLRGPKRSRTSSSHRTRLTTALKWWSQPRSSQGMDSNGEAPAQPQRPKSLQLVTVNSPVPKDSVTERSHSPATGTEANSNQIAWEVLESPSSSPGTLLRYNDREKLRNKAEKWKDK
eukprot:g36962.t1